MDGFSRIFHPSPALAGIVEAIWNWEIPDNEAARGAISIALRPLSGCDAGSMLRLSSPISTISSFPAEVFLADQHCEASVAS
jgi:hypothetical protein